MKSSKNFGRYLAIIAVIVSLILSGCGKKDQTVESVVTKKPVEVQTIAKQDDITTTLAATGTVVPKQYSVIRSVTPGTVEYLAPLGSSIAVGQPLFTITDSNIENAYFNASQNLQQTKSITSQRVSQAELAATGAQARFTLAQNNLTNAQQKADQNTATVKNTAVVTYDSAYSVSKQSLSYLSNGAIENFDFRYKRIASNDDQLRSDTDSQFQKSAQLFVQLGARADQQNLAGSLLQLQTSLMETKLAIDKTIVLLQGNSEFASQQLVVAGYQTQVNAQISAVIAAVDSLNSVVITNKLSIDQAQSQSDLAQIDLDNTKIALENAKNSATLENTIAQSSFDLAAYNYSNLSLPSPFAGTILSHYVKVGEQIQPGQQLVELGNLDIVEIAVAVDVDFARGLKRGDKVTINANQEGFIAEVEPSGNVQSGKVGVTVQSENAADTLTAGDVAEVQFSLTFNQPGSMVIPIKAAAIGANETSVLVAENGVAVKRVVTLGQIFGNRVVVTGGLNEGDQVIIPDGVFVADGDEVEIR